MTSLTTHSPKQSSSIPNTTNTTTAYTTNTHGYELVIFSGKPEEDPEVHILRMIDWMDTHNFAVGQDFP